MVLTISATEDSDTEDESALNSRSNRNKTRKPAAKKDSGSWRGPPINPYWNLTDNELREVMTEAKKIHEAPGISIEDYVEEDSEWEEPEGWNDDPKVASKAELPIGTRPRKYTDIKAKGTRKVVERGVRAMHNAMIQSTIPNTVTDGPFHNCAVIWFDQIMPNPSTKPEVSENYNEMYQKTRVIMHTHSKHSARVMMHVLKKHLEDDPDTGDVWQHADELDLTSPEKVAEVSGKVLSTNLDHTLYLLNGYPNPDNKIGRVEL